MEPESLFPEPDPVPSEAKAAETKAEQTALTSWFGVTAPKDPNRKVLDVVNTFGNATFGKIGGAVQQYEAEGTYNPAPIMEGVATVAGVNTPASMVRSGAGIFGGRMTQQSVDVAMKMEAEGASKHAVKAMTGLERGADNLWRREFSDADARFRFDKVTEKGSSLPDVLKHDTLFALYPEASQIKVVTNPEFAGTKKRGMFDPNELTVHLNPDLKGDDAQRVLLHEIQHWVQYKEGFSYSVPGQFSKDFRDGYFGEYVRKYGKPGLQKISEAAAAGRLDEAKSLAQKILDKKDYAVYLAQAAEQEAFNVSARAGMSAREIRQTLGSTTETVPRDSQIVLTPIDLFPKRGR